VTLPLALFTVTVNIAPPVPVTFFEAGVTWICPPLLDVALIVPAPVAFVRFTVTVFAPLLTIVNDAGLAFNAHCKGVAVAVGCAVGEGAAVGVAVGVGDG
jgi:hypothetical protein